MRVVVSQSFGAYSTPMSAVILRFLSLLALVLMPFGMGAAISAPANRAPAAATAEHCAEHGSQPAGKSAKHSADCAIACSMLMAPETRVEELAPAIRLPAARPLAERATGLHPDTATPPPKLS